MRDPFDWDDSILWGAADQELFEKAVILRRAPKGGYGGTHLGGQFIRADDWVREKALARTALPGLIGTFGKQMQYLRGVYEAQIEMGSHAPASMPSPGQTRWMMKTVIRDTYEAAFTLGKRAGGNLFAITADDRKAIDKTRRDEFKYLRKFMHDMEAGGGVMDYPKRMSYYVMASRELFNLGFVRADLSPDRQIWWRLGPTEHCPDCLGAEKASPMAADVFWRDYGSKGILPQSGALDCKGFYCRCFLRDSRPETNALMRGTKKRNAAAARQGA